MGDGGELDMSKVVSTVLAKNRVGYGAHVVEEELVITCHFGGGCWLGLDVYLLRVSARSFLG